MWGSAQRVALRNDNFVAQPTATTAQLAQIRYGRPDSWHFFFQVTILDLVGAVGAAQIQVDFNLTFGVGRATARVPTFARFNFNSALGELVPNFTKQATSTEFGPNNPARVGPNFCDQIVAETIQCDISASFPTGAGTLIEGTGIQCLSFFAPIVHVRPEWNIEHFPGNEIHGH